MEKRKVKIWIKYLNNLLNYFGKYLIGMQEIYISFKKDVKQLWIIGYHANRKLSHLVKIDYNEIFSFDESFDNMPDTLSVSFLQFSKFISRLELFSRKGFKDLELNIVFEPFIDYDFRIISFTLNDDELKLNQEVAPPVISNFHDNIEKVSILGVTVLKDLFETFQTKYDAITQSFSPKIVESDLIKLFEQTVRTYYLAKIKMITPRLILTAERLNLIFDKTSAIFKFGLKASFLNKLKRIKSLEVSDMISFEYDYESDSTELLIRGINFNWSYKDGYLRPLIPNVKFKFSVNSQIFKFVLTADYDVYIMENRMILESTKTNACFVIDFEDDEE